MARQDNSNDRYDVTIYFTNGTTERHTNVSADESRRLENRAFTDKTVSSVSAYQR